VITFRVTVDATVNQVFNTASSRTDVDSDQNFDEEQILNVSMVNSNQVVWTRDTTAGTVEEADPEELPDELPKTGFTPNVVTILPEQPADQAYRTTDVWLEIPNLGVKMPIVGVPLANGDWNLSWLWDEAGWLEGTAFPSWQGNSVLTGHVTLPNGEAGPFASLSDLSWGDQILVHAYGTVYTYEVRQNRTVSPYNTSIFKHEEEAWLTLLTCKTYNESTGTYSSRVAVRAVLMGIAKDKSGSGMNVK
jgi:LPXTG-site transpeptidase (sortase) family protein